MGKKNKAAKAGAHFFRKMRKHFHADPAELVMVSHSYPQYERPNIHLALEKLLGEPKTDVELEGIILLDHYNPVSLAQLTREVTARRYLPGPVEYHDVEIADGKRLSCVKLGIYWIRTPKTAVALLVHQAAHSFPPQISLEVIAGTREEAEDFGRRVALLVSEAMAFRGHILSLEMDCHHQLSVRFHRLPQVGREAIILPPDVLKRLDRQTIGMVEHADRLRKASRHLKRGVLLHGPPGTGKTLSAMYLAGLMPGRTVMILTGGGISSIEASGVLARALAPVTVILEDVDLIGTMREFQSIGANALLFELLNQMDGLAEDADVIFVLTSNRPELLEPALAARPGRIDQAIEIPGTGNVSFNRGI